MDSPVPAGRATAAGTLWMNFIAMLLFIGTFTGHGAEGISVAEFDPATGTLAAPALVAREESPTFLARHPTRPILYAVNEIEAGAGGFVCAFAVGDHGALRRLAREPSGGKSPTHLDVDPGGQMLVAANYGGPGVTSFHLDADGLPHPVSHLAHAAGSGVNPDRQDGPHPHAASFAPDGRAVLAPDLGADRVFLCRADPAAGTLEPAGSLAAAPGSGPRHVAFRPDGNAAFVIHELSNTIAVLRRGADGAWTTAQTVSTLPPGFAGGSGNNTAAEVALHPSGRFLFASNRGADTLATFRVNPADATLTALGQTPVGGRSPRHFTMDPTGRWLLVAGQDSNTITTFAIHPDTGALTPHGGEPVTTPSPTCLLFVPR